MCPSGATYLLVDCWVLGLLLYIPVNDKIDEDSSDWLLFNATWAIFQLLVYDDVKKLHFNEMMIISSLFYINKLSRIFLVLAHWNNTQQSTSKYVAPLGHNVIIYE
jgi:hypothetical protein